MENLPAAGSRLYSAPRDTTGGAHAATNWSRGLQFEVLGVMAHELRTPIQVLIGYLEILRDELVDDLNLERRGIIDRMNVSIYELSQSIENLMDFILADDDAKPGPDENISLGSLIADVTPVLEAANFRKQLNLRFETSRAPEIIRAPRRALRSIILNLALNAIKFTDSGTVTISIRQAHGDGAGHAIEIEVEDTGPGMAAAQFERVSKPFAQLSNSTHRRHRGLGLGLTLVRRHTAAIGGKLELRSEAGKGAKFAVRFPARARPAAEKQVFRHSGNLPHHPPAMNNAKKPEKPLRR